ncbi:hypothetical protein [Brevundimonas sp.]|uniref:hypothetical protein n=1 Tax=Brevundimonas sp. TaxID=1871086 RepID=UPI0024889FC1|nr:hypothetical protein [Brevundimonas sp.]MDI1281292.1 hypothetical protein [Brevundimonas sp.]
MRFSQPVRMADGGETSPVWARSRKRSGMPIVGLLVTLLALFGALTAVLGIKEQSLAAGGAVVDGWITSGWDGARGLIGKAPAAADDAAAEAGAAAAKAGDALQAGAETTANEMKK